MEINQDPCGNEGDIYDSGPVGNSSGVFDVPVSEEQAASNGDKETNDRGRIRRYNSVSHKTFSSLFIGAHLAIFAMVVTSLHASEERWPVYIAIIVCVVFYVLGYFIGDVFLGESTRLPSVFGDAQLELPPEASLPAPSPATVAKEVIQPTPRYLVISSEPFRMKEMPRGMTLQHLQNMLGAMETGMLRPSSVSARKLEECKIITRDTAREFHGSLLLRFLADAGLAERYGQAYDVNKRLVEHAVTYTEKYYRDTAPPHY